MIFIKTTLLIALWGQLPVPALDINNALSSYKPQTDTSAAKLYLNVDQIPRFRGGNNLLDDYITKNFEWPSEEADFAGTILTSFIVEEDGALTNIRILTNNCPPCEKQVLKLIANMPRWSPGKVNKRPVRTLVYLPIKLKIIE